MRDIDREIRTFLDLTFGHRMRELTDVQRDDLVFILGTLALRRGADDDAVDTAIGWLEHCARAADSVAPDAGAWARETTRRFEDSSLASHEASVLEDVAEDARRRGNGS